MSSGWGIRIIIPAGRNADPKYFDTSILLSQLKQLESPRWIMLNLTGPSNGAVFSEASKMLSNNISPDMAPEHGLFKYLAQKLRAQNYKIIAYYAAQGPYSQNIKIKAINKTLPELRKGEQFQVEISRRWGLFARARHLSPFELNRRLLQDYADSLGKLVDGWWFDYGNWANPEDYRAAILHGNRSAAMAWNTTRVINILFKGDWGLSGNANYEDFTAGHPFPLKFRKPWWNGNEKMIREIEANCSFNNVLGHIILPLQQTWLSGKAMFPRDKAISWTTRVVKAQGAFTWASEGSWKDKKLQIPERQFQLLLDIDRKVTQLIGKREGNT